MTSLFSSTRSGGSYDSAVVFVGAVALDVVSMSGYNVLPLLTDGATHTLGFSSQQVGVLSLAIGVGAGISAFAASVWVRSVNWPRAAAMMLVGMIVTNVLSALLHSYWPFVLSQGAAGFFGGSLLCLALTILSDQHEPARAFGMASALQFAYQIAALLSGPALLQLAGVNGILVMLAALSCGAILLTPLLPVRGRAVSSGGISRMLFKPGTFLALMGYAIYWANFGAYWTYIELMGQARGMTLRVVSNCIAAGLSAGVLGGILAWALGDRLGRVWPLGIATLITLFSALLLNRPPSLGAFVVSSLLYFFACNYALAHQAAVVSTVDATGRAVATLGGIGALGAAAGAALAGRFVTPGDYRAVIWLISIGAVASTVLFVLSIGVNRRTVSSNANCGHALPDKL